MLLVVCRVFESEPLVPLRQNPDWCTDLSSALFDPIMLVESMEQFEPFSGRGTALGFIRTRFRARDHASQPNQGRFVAYQAVSGLDSLHESGGFLFGAAPEMFRAKN